MVNFSAEYRAWRRIADTALPQNLLGYMITICLEPFRTDPFAVQPYDNPKELAKCGPNGKKSFLSGELPQREGPRPGICKWIAPSRQVSQLTGEEMHKLLETVISHLVTKYSSCTVLRTSPLEKSGQALMIADHIPSPHSIARSTKREIVHIHTEGQASADYSLHLCLSPADCKEVITKGYGERMSLAGSFMPEEYLIIYTPRTQEEVEVVGRIVEGAIGFMTGMLVEED